MTPRPDHPEDQPTPLPDALVAGLRALRADVPPGRDLWPGIAVALETPAAAVPATTAPEKPRRHGRRHARRNAGYAAAAAVVLAAGIGWQLSPRIHPAPSAVPADAVVATGATADAGAPLLRAADALAREYQGALREVQAASGSVPAAGDTATAASGLDADLERSATEIRAALARDPDALHLLHRLQRIYAHRLALSLRQA